MAVKKGILDNFLKPNSIYSGNQQNLRSIFIDNNDTDLNERYSEQSNTHDNELVVATNKESIGNQLVTKISNQLVTNKEPISNHIKNSNDHKKYNKEPIGKRIGNRK